MKKNIKLCKMKFNEISGEFRRKTVHKSSDKHLLKRYNTSKIYI